jgi:hypothetical protein
MNFFFWCQAAEYGNVSGIRSLVKLGAGFIVQYSALVHLLYYLL